MKIQNNIKDVALIFEGGGMRASYTSGFLNVLLENEIYFNYVAGISAGASNTVNYLSRDKERTKISFVDLVLDPNFGGWRSFLKGEGFFRSKYIYEETPHPDAALPFDFHTFKNNPAKIRIGAVERDSGELIYFSKEDIKELHDLMKIVRASSSMPIFMPPTKIQDKYYVDGGISGGIALDIAKKDGHEKFFIVLTRPKGYRKEPIGHRRFIRRYYRKYPKVYEAMIHRHVVYNETLDELEALEKQGKAFLVYPDTMPVSNRETNHKKLVQSYELGYRQGKRDLPRWKNFLNID